jgi:hypothetical protein
MTPKGGKKVFLNWFRNRKKRISFKYFQNKSELCYLLRGPKTVEMVKEEEERSKSFFSNDASAYCLFARVENLRKTIQIILLDF